MTIRRDPIEIVLNYEIGTDEFTEGWGDVPVRPEFSSELMIAIRDHPEWAEEDAAEGEEPVYPDNPSQLQVHLIGTSRALEALGTHLIGLARLETDNPEPSTNIDDVAFSEGGTIRFLPRRLDEMSPRQPRGNDYNREFCPSLRHMTRPRTP